MPKSGGAEVTFTGSTVWTGAAPPPLTSTSVRSCPLAVGATSTENRTISQGLVMTPRGGRGSVLTHLSDCSPPASGEPSSAVQGVGVPLKGCQRRKLRPLGSKCG